jgi:hypothetical protein
MAKLAGATIVASVLPISPLREAFCKPLTHFFSNKSYDR